MKRLALLLLVGGIAAGAGLLVWRSTPFGAGLSPDSAVYVAMADGAWTPRGFVIPFAQGHYMNVTHFPPFYPIALSAGRAAGIPPVPFSRSLSCALLAMTVFISGLLVFWLSSESLFSAAAAAAVTALSVDLLAIHSMAWSEPLFLLLTLGGVALVARWLADESAAALLVGAGLLGLAAATRYAGLAGLGALAVCLAFDARSRRRPGLALSALAVAALPIGAWFLRNYLLASRMTDRRFAVHLEAFRQQMTVAFDAVQCWVACRTELTPAAPWPAIVAGAALVVGPWLWWNATHQASPREAAFRRASGLYALAYAGLLATTLLFLDASTPLDFRLISPLHVLAIVAVATAWSRWRRTSPAAPAKGASILLTLGYIGLLGWLARDWSLDVRDDGQQYASRRYRESPLLALVRRSPDNAILYTTSPGPLYLYVGRSGVELPLKRIRETQAANPEFEGRMAILRKQIDEKKAAIVYFTQDIEPVFPRADELARVLGQGPIRAADGAYWGAVAAHGTR